MNQPAAQRQAPRVLTGLPKRLVEGGYITERDVPAILGKAKSSNRGFLECLVDDGMVDDVIAAHIAAEEFGLPLLRLSALDRGTIPTTLNEASLIKELRAVIIKADDTRLSVAISDPLNFVALDEIRTRYQRAVQPILVCHSELRELIHSTFGQDDDSMNFDEFFGQIEVEAEEEDDGQDLAVDEDDAPAVRFVNQMLLEAIRKGGSDIHIEPYEKYLRARLRLDGVLREVAHAPKAMTEKICARVKVMANLDVAERRVPQDGRIRVKVNKNKKIDFRVNTCPTLFGEKIVMRQLDSSSAMLGIEVLGYEPEQRRLYEQALAKPYGMILVTGPTGSGKTVSLYTGLNILNTEDRNISTAEDPSEINLPGINQVNVNPKVGLTFASALKAFLRQDPDVIMVGEIRDLDTATIAIKAAQTGHLVLSTLHTNDAPQTLTRMMDMGVPPYSIATSVTLIIAQRLARRLCQNCCAPADIPHEVLLSEGFTEDDIANGTINRPVGCNQCNAGYKGRVGVYQVMPVSENMQRIILRNGTALDIASQATEEGVDDLRRSAIKKVCAGLTSLEEINRVTKD